PAFLPFYPIRIRFANRAIVFDPAAAQALSDKAVAVIRAADAGELLPRIAAASDFYLCRTCAYAKRCWASQ
ncbi:MAG: hypothetical protein P9C55_12830, partial [Defluviicoccus sp.]|nr:hypothetical protein [Defluviicoccus sp.]